MSATTPALIAAAAGVGLGHAILPDHWVPLAVVGRTQHYSLRRVARLSALAGFAHVLVSLALGSIIIVVGLQFRSAVESAQNTIVGGLLILTGLAFVLLELTGHGHHHHHDHDHGHDHGHPDPDAHPHPHDHDHPPATADPPTGRARRLATIMVPFGAAASPDLTILPVFLAATAAGAAAAVGALVVFSAVTIGTIIGLTLLACFGGYQLHGEWLDRWGNLFT
ncbi:MAG TPA: hypothetical protein VFR49_04140, partial [Solirubrobacteraceae bacterium]|nr:hypothetical protein [Solirubrobacteraceae bacterium]